jgi:hypothetical protein
MDNNAAAVCNNELASVERGSLELINSKNILRQSSVIL